MLQVSVEISAISTNIFEEGGGQGREAKLDMKDDKQNASQASPDAHLLELSRIRYDRRREQLGGGMEDKFFTECDIFQNRLRWKSAYCVKEALSDKKGLIPINYS